MPPICILAIGSERFAGAPAFSGGLPTAALVLFSISVLLCRRTQFHPGEQGDSDPHSPSGPRGVVLWVSHLRGDESHRPAAFRLSTQGVVSVPGLGHGTVRSHVLYRASDLTGGAPDITQKGFYQAPRNTKAILSRPGFDCLTNIAPPSGEVGLKRAVISVSEESNGRDRDAPAEADIDIGPGRAKAQAVVARDRTLLRPPGS